MKPHAALLVLAVFASPLAAVAQTGMVQQINPDAERLAADMRILADNPINVAALVSAGEMSLRMGDLNAAVAFFGRANAVDPRNARVKAGEAAALVQLQRPGEALRLFQEAERLGLDAAYFAGNRGLAYDLIGEQDRAQRDYQTALTRERSDETLRRYALSLGISGNRDAAFAQIDPLLRRSDRAAWRARAFIMALTGDVRGAETIARSMLGSGMANGLAPSFAKLPALGAADRAFAVHFGELGSSPIRLADARAAPPLPPLIRAVSPPVRTAAVAPRTSARPSRAELRREAAAQRETLRAERRAQQAAARRAPARRPIEVASVGRVATGPVVQRPPPPARPAPGPLVSRPVAVAAASPPRALAPPPANAREPVAIAARGVTLSDMAARPSVRASGSFAPVRSADAAVPLPAPAASGLASIPVRSSAIPASSSFPITAPLPVAGASAAPVAPLPASPVAEMPVAAAVQGGMIAAPPIVTSAAIPIAVAAVPVAGAAVAPATPRPTPAASSRGRDLLASIIAGIAIPAAELGVAPMPGASPAPGFGGGADEPAEPVVRVARAEPAPPRAKVDPKPKVEPKPKPKPEPVEPSRHWAQVAGGANTATLPREWQRLRDKSPEAFKPVSAWTAPLRATNRLLAGPFESERAAQSFVNRVAKDGITGFVFTSADGQKISKLSTQ